MKSAIAVLEIALGACEVNEPINRAEGNDEQADLEAANANEYKEAIAVVKIHSERGVIAEIAERVVEMLEEKKAFRADLPMHLSRDKFLWLISNDIVEAIYKATY